jgi:hypothetical protein
MKKFLLIILLFLGFIIQIQAHNDTLAVLVWVEDAVGNRDSVFIYLKGEATDGLDPELGEVNLYGTPPQSELDLRIIQRTDTNFLKRYPYYQYPYWLTGLSWIDPNDTIGVGYSWCPPYNENVDLKKNYVGYIWQWYGGCRRFALRCSTINVPLKFTIETSNPMLTSLLIGIGGTGYYVITLHDASNGKLKPRLHHTIEPGYGEYVILSANIPKENINDIILIEMCSQGFVLDSIEKKTLFPNPTSDFVVLEDCEYNDEYKIFDINGNMIEAGFIDNAECLVNISGLLPATYHIKVKNNIYKLIKIDK